MKFLLLTLLLTLAACSAEYREVQPKATPAPPPSNEAATKVEKPRSENWPNKNLEKKTDSVLEQLINQVSLVFTMPPTANLQDRIRAQLMIDLNKSVDQLVVENKLNSNTITGTFKTTRIVTARLIAPDFDVTAVESAEQVLLDGTTTKWNWELQPKSAGKHIVMLTVDATVEINGRDKTAHIRTFEEQVLIEVTAGQIISTFIANNWQWLWSTLLVPFALWFWRRHLNK
jgi:hypothetical protein